MRRVVLFLILLALASHGGALAATLQDDFPTVGTFHWGPFRVRPFFLLKGLGYDSNVFLEDATATSDFAAAPEVGIRMFSLLRNRGVVQIEELLDYVWYATNADLNHFNNAFQARGAYYMRRGYAFAELRTLSLKERPSSEIDYRIRRRERLIGAGWRFVWPKSSLQFRLGRDLFDYEAGTEAGQSIPPALNRVEQVITVSGTKRIRPKTDLLLEWEARQIDFTEAAGSFNDSRSRRLSAGFQFDPSAFIQGAVKVGLQNLVPDDPSREGFHGPVGEGILIYRVSGRTSFEMRARRAVQFTTAPNNIYYTDQGYGATLTQALSDRVAGEIGIDREKIEFPVETTVCNPDLGSCDQLSDPGFVTGFRTDKIPAYFAGASYRMSNLSKIGLRVGVWERNSAPPFEFLNRHRLTAQVIYAYNF